MEKIYTDADYLAIYNQRNKVIRDFIIMTSIYAVWCIFWVIYHTTLPYADPHDAFPRAMAFIGTIIYVLIAFPYLTIKYRRVHHYYKMFCQFGSSLKIEETYHFYAFRAEITQKNHVDAISCIFATYNQRNHEWMEREIYCDPEKPLPPFERGDLVHYVTQSNFLLEYEILEKQAMSLDGLFKYEFALPNEAEQKGEKDEDTTNSSQGE